jgi:intracellular sulfur oxidation DsrE/DsrF family protein
VNFDSLSEYHDYDTTMADPNVTTKRYKISVVDTCGNESAKSNFHNTIFIQHNNGTFTWNTYTIQNSPNPVTSYRLMRDDFATGNWQQIGVTAGTQNVLNDPNYSSFASTADWRVETVWGISCTPTLRQSNGVEAAIVKSKSNISNNRAVGVKESSAGIFAVYPNPAMDVVTIAFEKTGLAKIEIMNALGETVRVINTSMQSSTVNTGDLTSGVYYVKVSSEGKQGVSRLVIQK